MEISIEQDKSYTYGVNQYVFNANGSAHRISSAKGPNRIESYTLLDLAENAEFILDLVIYPTYVYISNAGLFKYFIWSINGRGNSAENTDALIDVVQLNGDNLKVTSATMVVGGETNARNMAYQAPPMFTKASFFKLDVDSLANGSKVPIFKTLKKPDTWELGIRGKIGPNR